MNDVYFQCCCGFVILAGKGKDYGRVKDTVTDKETALNIVYELAEQMKVSHICGR